MPSLSPKSRSSFGSDSLALIGGQIIITVFSLGSAVITARALNADGRGQFSLALLLAYTLFMFTEFGLGSAGTRLVATGRWPKPEILASHIFAIAVRALVAGLIGLLVVLLAHDLIFSGMPVKYLLLGILQIFPLMVAGSVLPLLLGLGLAKTYNRILVLSSLLAFGAFSIAWVLVGLSVSTALILQLGVGIVISVVIWRKTNQAVGGPTRPNFRYLAEAYRFGIGMYASGVLAFANTRLIWLLINSFVGVVGVGLYTIAQAATERIYLIADALGTILFPRIAEDPESNSARVTPTVFRIALITSAGLSIGLALMADWLVRFLFSASFAGAVSILRLLLVAVVLSSGWRILSQDLNGRGYSGITAAVNGVATALGLGLAWLLLPQFGLEGAAWSAIAAAGMSLITGVWLFGHYCRASQGISSLFVLSTREREFVAHFLRGSVEAVKHGPSFVRGLVGRLYWWAQYIRRECMGTRIDERIWKNRSRSHVQRNLGNVLLPHRAWLIDRILVHLDHTSQEDEGQPHTSVLEIGCGCGANLEVLARRAPSLRLVGIDINPASISVGRERFAELGLRGITLVEGKADNLVYFDNASVDVVFTDAMLLYIGPDKIQTCIEEIKRIAKRAIIFLEMHMDGAGSAGLYTRDGWVRDYTELCKRLGSDIKVTRMPTEKRPAGRWPKYGTLIEVRLQR